MQARPLPGTRIVELRAEGARAKPLAPALNTLFEVYREHSQAGLGDDLQQVNAQARAEAAAL